MSGAQWLSWESIVQPPLALPKEMHVDSTFWGDNSMAVWGKEAPMWLLRRARHILGRDGGGILLAEQQRGLVDAHFRSIADLHSHHQTQASAGVFGSPYS